MKKIRPIRRAGIQDIPAICKLMNVAYRGKTGQSWTTEKDMIAGDRISPAQLQEHLVQQNFELWLLEGQMHAASLIGCIGICYQGDKAEIGSFSVDPALQNQGLGKELLNFAEQQVIAHYPEIKILEMYVLSLRTELMAFYARCGYLKTAHTEEYPIYANVGTPLANLHLVQMIKVLKI